MFNKLKNNHYWLFKPKYQKPQLQILGSLIFWVGLPWSEPAWSAASVDAATISVSQIDQKENTAVTFASKDSDTKLNSEILSNLGAGRAGKAGEEKTGLSKQYWAGKDFLVHFCGSRLDKQGERSSANMWQENFSSASPAVPTPPASIEHQTSASEQTPPCNPTPLSVVTDVGSLPTPENEASQTGNRPNSEQPANREDPELGNLRLRLLEGLPTPESQPSRIEHDSDSEQLANREDPELGNLRLRQLEGSPTSESQPSGIGNRSDSEQPASSEDPELGNLRLRELERPPALSQPAVYLLGGVSYLRSNNVFSDVKPVDDGLVRGGLTLLANPSLGPQTSLFASVGGNLIRYGSQSQFDYNELRFNFGIRQELSPRAYGEVGWSNRQLFDKESGDRFLNDHSLYLELGRRDSLAKHLTLDTYYQFRLSFADPTSRSQAINSMGATLAYNPSPSLQLALDYQFSLANFTQQERQDQFHQLIARLTYTLSPSSRLYLFGGHSFGSSSDPTIDFNGFIFGAGVDFNLTLF